MVFSFYFCLFTFSMYIILSSIAEVMCLAINHSV